MADSPNKKGTRVSRRAIAPVAVAAEDIARAGADEYAQVTEKAMPRGFVGASVSLKQSDTLLDEERRQLRRKVRISVVCLIVLAYVSLGFMGAAGQYYPYVGGYTVLNPVQVTQTIAVQLHDLIGSVTHLWSVYPRSFIVENYPGYWGVWYHAGVIGITVVCAVLLSVAGMLYQNVFHNPIASPGMLGASSGVTLGIIVLVAVYGVGASSMLVQRYALCYGFGLVILLVVLLAGRKLSGKGHAYNIVTTMLVGMLLSSLIGNIVSFVTLYVWDADYLLLYQTMSQQLQVDTSVTSWIVLAVMCAVTLIPVYRKRFQLNALAFDEAQARLLGVDSARLRGLALICGALMMVAAQIHVGVVSLVTLVVPYLSRSIFGCEFRKQLIGNVCIGPILLLVCRDIVDLIPFVGDGIGIGSVVGLVALPLFVVVMARGMRGWE